MRWLYIKKWHYWWISTNWCVFEHWKYGSIMKFYLAPVRWKILYNQTQELWIYGLYYTPNFFLLRLSMSKHKKTVVTGTLPTLMITTEIVITWRNLHSIFSFNVQSLTVFDSKFFFKSPSEVSNAPGYSYTFWATFIYISNSKFSFLLSYFLPL